MAAASPDRAAATVNDREPVVIRDPSALRRWVGEARAAGRRVGFVPTMGALHAGHGSLVDRAVAECDDVVVSIFVNPMQFGPTEDFTRYPRPLGDDLSLLARHGARWVLVPDAAAVYPPGAATRVVVDGPALPFEGTERPGHFAGVATVVLWLFQVCPADVAYFGAKDWQQTRVVSRMVRDLAVPIEIRICPTVREPDGLAMSSRNAYLSAEDRRRAPALFDSLCAAETLWLGGADVPEIELEMRRVMESRGIVVDYAAVVDADELVKTDRFADRRAVALVAGRIGATRLIDNRELPPRHRVG